MTVRGTTIRTEPATLAAAEISAPTAVLAAGSYNTRADVDALIGGLSKAREILVHG